MAKNSSAPITGRGGARKDEIRKRAAELFAQNGYHATGISEVGEAVGLGRGALYHHIRSKEELLYEIASEHVIRMVAFGEELLVGDLPPLEKFRQLSAQLMRTIAQNLPELTVFFSEHRSLTGKRAEHLHALRERFEQIWLGILTQGRDEGLLRSADPIVVKAILGMHNYSYLWLDPRGRLDPDEISDVFCDLLLSGLLLPRTDGK